MLRRWVTYLFALMLMLTCCVNIEGLPHAAEHKDRGCVYKKRFWRK